MYKTWFNQCGAKGVNSSPPQVQLRAASISIPSTPRSSRLCWDALPRAILFSSCCWCCCRRVHTATPRELQYPLPLHAPRAPAFVLPPQGFSCWCSFLHNGRVPTMEAQHISLLRQGRVALAFHQTPPTIILRSPDFSCCCTSQVRRQHHRTFVQPRLRHRRVPTMVWHSTLPC